ncbi:MAG: hypothetical protein IPH66_15885 [Crocinitomicaceae bacterium]|nr:hypothetical protein [Crocinitomicaceae bacterium]
MAYSNNDSSRYVIPSVTKETAKCCRVKNSAGGTGSNAFLDSTKTITRITMQIRDTGAYEIQAIVDSIKP